MTTPAPTTNAPAPAEAPSDRRKATIRLKVAFCDLDPLEVVWHGNYLRYFEAARQALFEGVGINFYRTHIDFGYLFPVVKARVKYIAPLRLGDEFLVTARLVEASARIVIDFEIHLASDGSLRTRARTDHLALRADDLTLDIQVPVAIQRAFGLDAGPPSERE
jgi:acyl-CoA thioester hydrolase